MARGDTHTQMKLEAVSSLWIIVRSLHRSWGTGEWVYKYKDISIAA